MKNSYLSILRIVLHGRASGRILIATVVSFTFSIAVILCTFGLMDGFDHVLKSGLRNSSGDILITNKKGFFDPEGLRADLGSHLTKDHTAIIQTEAFALAGGKSKGVLVRGVDSNFPQVSGLTIPAGPGLTIGTELARELGIKAGDEIALALGSGNQSAGGLPTVRLFPVKGTLTHGIYQKDLRFIYMDKDSLAEELEVGNKINLFMLSHQPPAEAVSDLAPVETKVKKLRQILDGDYRIRPFWDEYDFLIEAVKVEKLSISIILQLIVVVAVFNIIAFVIYVMEKKSQDFFFLRAVGLSLRDLMRFWFISVLIVWSVSCVGAYFLSHLFNWALGNLSMFAVPGEIYVLSRLSLRLDFVAHATVYTVSLLWILGAAMLGYIRLRRRPIIQGLRQEFS